MSRTLTIDDGDVVLFSRRCLSMPFVPAFICASAKLTAWTPYDHIGVVTRDPSTGRLQLLEANMGGVTAHALHERLVRSKALAFAVRKLVATGSGGGRDVSTARRDIQACAREIVGRPYNPSFLDMTRALAASVVHHGTAAAAACDHAHRVARDAPSSPTAALAAPVADDRATTSRGYYCSHLVADVLVRAGVLARARRSQDHIPADFSSSTWLRTMHTVPGYALGPDLVVPKAAVTGYAEEHGRLTVTFDTTPRPPPSPTSTTTSTTVTETTRLAFAAGDEVALGTLAAYLGLCPSPSTARQVVRVTGSGAFDVCVAGATGATGAAGPRQVLGCVDMDPPAITPAATDNVAAWHLLAPPQSPTTPSSTSTSLPTPVATAGDAPPLLWHAPSSPPSLTTDQPSPPPPQTIDPATTYLRARTPRATFFVTTTTTTAAP